MVGISWLFFAALPVAGAARTHLFAVMRRMATTHALNDNSRTYTVRATAYEAVASQTDSRPFITADNSRIPKGYGSHTRWLALSRDLLRPWGGPFEFGDRVRVRGISPALDGVYTVHDTMNRRYRHCLDVLVHPREHVTISRAGVQIKRISPSQPLSSTTMLLTSLRTSRQKSVARRRTRAHQEVARHTARPARRGRARALAIASRPATHLAKQLPRTKRNPRLTHQKHSASAAKQQLTALPKRTKKGVAARAHPRPTA